MPSKYHSSMNKFISKKQYGFEIDNSTLEGIKETIFLNLATPVASHNKDNKTQEHVTMVTLQNNRM